MCADEDVQEVVHCARETFEKFDVDGSNALDREELVLLVQHLFKELGEPAECAHLLSAI